MGYFGKSPSKDITQTFKLVVEARDKVIELLKSTLKNDMIAPGRIADSAAREYLADKGLDHLFKHSTGHALGFTSAHGRTGGGLRQKNKKSFE